MNKRFRLEDWLDIGIQQLADMGPAGLTLESLCEKTGKTRGSFYHHFTDHHEYIESMMARWKKISTDDIIEKVNGIKDISQRLQELNKLAMGLDKKIEIAVRQYAQSNIIAAKYQEQVDQIRISYLAKSYEKIENLPNHLSNRLAKLEYAAFIGAQILKPTSIDTEMVQLDKTFQEMSKLWIESKRN